MSNSQENIGSIQTHQCGCTWGALSICISKVEQRRLSRFCGRKEAFASITYYIVLVIILDFNLCVCLCAYNLFY